MKLKNLLKASYVFFPVIVYIGNYALLINERIKIKGGR